VARVTIRANALIAGH